MLNVKTYLQAAQKWLPIITYILPLAIVYIVHIVYSCVYVFSSVLASGAYEWTGK